MPRNESTAYRRRPSSQQPPRACVSCVVAEQGAAGAPRARSARTPRAHASAGPARRRAGARKAISSQQNAPMCNMMRALLCFLLAADRIGGAGARVSRGRGGGGGGATRRGVVGGGWGVAGGVLGGDALPSPSLRLLDETRDAEDGGRGGSGGGRVGVRTAAAPRARAGPRAARAACLTTPPPPFKQADPPPPPPTPIVKRTGRFFPPPAMICGDPETRHVE